jgi:hypothetical protein
MNREGIKKTAVCRYDKRKKVYIVESPLLDICHGIANTEQKAWEIFEDLLNAMYIEYLEGRKVGQYSKRGRPRKGGVAFNANIKSTTKKMVANLASHLGISQGEVMDFMVASWQARQSTQAESYSGR